MSRTKTLHRQQQETLNDWPTRIRPTAQQEANNFIVLVSAEDNSRNEPTRQTRGTRNCSLSEGEGTC